MSTPAAARVAQVQGAYFLGTGVWSLVDIHSFERVTGPKTDDWLVKTVGVLVSVIGSTLLLGGIRGRVTPELALLGAGSAAVLTAVETYYTAKKRISPIYLGDAILQAGLLTAWLNAIGPREAAWRSGCC